MRSEAIGKLVNKPVKDSYGRYVGFVVGFSVESSGELTTVGVDQGNGEFAEYPSKRLAYTSDGFIVIPEWKIGCEALGKELDGVRKRAKALQDLAHEGEIPQAICQEMMAKYSEEADKTQESYRSLTQGMVVRVGELEEQNGTLERFLANLKVQFRAGEIDEGAFKVSSECCQAMLNRNSQETGELEKTLKTVTRPMSSETTTAAPSPREQPQVQTVAQKSPA